VQAENIDMTDEKKATFRPKPKMILMKKYVVSGSASIKTVIERVKAVSKGNFNNFTKTKANKLLPNLIDNGITPTIESKLNEFESIF
jgi:hypothetical protein